MTIRFPIPRVAAALALLVVVGACETARSVAGKGPSPFRLFERDDMRAGMSFEELEAATRRESPIRFNCWDTLPAQKMRMCKTTISPGDLFALVGPDKRIVRLLFVSYEPTRLEENYQSDNFKRSVATVQQMAAEFDSIMPRRTLAGRPVEFRWIGNEPTYSAGMWFMPREHYLARSRNSDQVRDILRRTYRDSLALVPDSIAITDERAYAALLAANPRPEPKPVVYAAAPPPEVAPLPPSPADRLTSMRTELERLGRDQETYFIEHGEYSASLDALGFTPQFGVVVEISAKTAGGYIARSSHEVMPRAVCVIYGGSVKVLPVAGTMGSPNGPGFAMCDPG
jgi:hypothetical protein